MAEMEHLYVKECQFSLFATRVVSRSALSIITVDALSDITNIETFVILCDV